ncbi:conserved hypothetical protein [Pseudomonas sp. PM2]
MRKEGDMSEASKRHESNHSERKVRPPAAKRNDKSQAPAGGQQGKEQGGVAPGGPSKDPESGA